MTVFLAEKIVLMRKEWDVTRILVTSRCCTFRSLETRRKLTFAIMILPQTWYCLDALKEALLGFSRKIAIAEELSRET